VSTLIRITILLLLALPAMAQRPIEFSAFEFPASGSIVIPVAEGDSLTGLAATLDTKTDGAISMATTEASFTGETNQTLTLFGVKPYSRIDLIGIGRDPLDRVAAENFGGKAASLNNGTSGTTTNILWASIDRDDDATAARVAFGYRLGDYRFDRYHEDRLDPSTLGSIRIFSDDAGAGNQFTSDLSHLAAAVYLARDLSSEPGNVIYPQSFVDRVREQFHGLKNVKIKVLDEDDLERLGMGAHLGVGSGSSRPPRLLVIRQT
jgi:leucyl aminopeptidase